MLSNIVLNDLWVLRLDDLEYCQVLFSSELQMEPRYNHTAVQFGSKLILFGGMNAAMTLEMSVQEFELDSAKVEAKAERDRSERERLRQLADAIKRRKEQLSSNQQSSNA